MSELKTSDLDIANIVRGERPRHPDSLSVAQPGDPPLRPEETLSDSGS